VQIVRATNDTEFISSDKTFWLDFPVTTTEDAGPGSLRQTIFDMNASAGCGSTSRLPCRAAFRLPEGTHTIRPPPLPALDIYWPGIEGSITLDGSALVTGNGLEITKAAFVSEIRGLTIEGFPWNGIHTASRISRIDACNIRGNGSRGIAVEGTSARIEHCVIEGNARSGVFLAGGDIGGPHIRDNRIARNGASGIFVGDFTHAYQSPVIENNVIEDNAHFGVAVSLKAPVSVLVNTIRDNGQGGIDIRLDGPTEFVEGIPGLGGVLRRR